MNAIRTSLVALMLSSAMPVIAQDATSTSTSGSEATAGSISGSSADNTNVNGQGQSQTANNAGIGNSESTSVSGSNSEANTASFSEANGNQQDQGQGQSQGQGQTQNAASDQGQMQGQTSNQTAQQGNSQGVTFNQTWNSVQRKKTITEIRAASPVMLAASSSFSSDFCGATMSGGASGSAPIGFSIGLSGPRYDKSCQSLRRAEKFGMAAANYHNMGQPEMAMKMMSMMVWSICTSDTSGPKADADTAAACGHLLSSMATPPTPPQAYVAPQEVTPMHTQQDNLDPNQYENLPPKAPRGEAPSQKVTPPMAYTTAP